VLVHRKQEYSWPTIHLRQTTHGHDIDQLKDANTRAVVAPAEFASGELAYPYADARK
jgi:hypothetical protein